MNRHLVAAILVVAVVEGLQAETLRLPAKYIFTSYTVHLLTGETSNERVRERKTPAPVEVTRTVLDGEEVIQFVTQPISDEDESDTTVAHVTMAERDKILAVLAEADDLGRKARSKREDIRLERFKSADGKIVMAFVTTNLGRAWRVEWAIGQRVYVVGRRHIRSVSRTLKKY